MTNEDPKPSVTDEKPARELHYSSRVEDLGAPDARPVIKLRERDFTLSLRQETNAHRWFIDTQEELAEVATAVLTALSDDARVEILAVALRGTVLGTAIEKASAHSKAYENLVEVERRLGDELAAMTGDLGKALARATIAEARVAELESALDVADKEIRELEMR